MNKLTTVEAVAVNFAREFEKVMNMSKGEYAAYQREQAKVKAEREAEIQRELDNCPNQHLCYCPRCCPK